MYILNEEILFSKSECNRMYENRLDRIVSAMTESRDVFSTNDVSAIDRHRSTKDLSRIAVET